MTPRKGWLDWLLSEDRRHTRRRKSLPLVAYYWDGAQPISHPVHDLSSTGFYLLTDHRWYPGTILAVTLQRTEASAEDQDRAISINARVIRSGSDGVGFEFVLPERDSSHAPLPGLPAAMIDRKTLDAFLAAVKGSTTGQNE